MAPWAKVWIWNFSFYSIFCKQHYCNILWRCLTPVLQEDMTSVFRLKSPLRHWRLSPLSLKWFTEDSDELWMRHCQRDFKRESPQEYESWREMYLRLHDEREERLKMLTQNISSAHANKPKGRKASAKRKLEKKKIRMKFINDLLCVQDDKLRWHLWTRSPNRRVTSAVGRKGLAPPAARLQPPPPLLRRPSGQCSAAWLTLSPSSFQWDFV